MSKSMGITQAQEPQVPTAWSKGRRLGRDAGATIAQEWGLDAQQLAKVAAGERVYPLSSRYINGFMLRLFVQREACDKGHTLGIYYSLDTAAMVAAGVPWSAEDAVALGHSVSINAATEIIAVSSSATKLRIFGFAGWGWPNFLSKSAPSIPELVAPQLVEGQLRISCTWTKVDMVGKADLAYKSMVLVPTRRPTWLSGMHL